ncbi:hypothetical protein MMC12_008526 [Toensbergia leucococca]|nr:hypothetical protein [Toensbergia leucococca]
MGAKPYIVELDQVDDGAQLQDALYEISQQSTVPNIFIRDSGKGGDNGHIGGNDKLQAKRAELPKLLKNAGAI